MMQCGKKQKLKLHRTLSLKKDVKQNKEYYQYYH